MVSSSSRQGRTVLTTTALIFIFFTCILLPLKEHLESPLWFHSASRLTSEIFDKNLADGLSNEIMTPNSQNQNSESFNNPFSTVNAQSYYETLFSVIKNCNPNLSTPLAYNTNKTTTNSNSEDDSSDNQFSSVLEVSFEDTLKLRESHKKALSTLPNEAPAGLYKGSGIVVIGGGERTPIALVSIRMLRKVNKDVPIELVVNEDEKNDSTLCSEVLPSLNAQCLVLSEALGQKAASMFKLERQQVKSLALLASSFDSIILLEAENVLMKDPSALLNSKPFKKYGAILWPSVQPNSVSPVFYKAANSNSENDYNDKQSSTHDHNKERQTTKAVAFLPEYSTESGQIMINKSRHFKSIALTVYYNLYGQSAFYALLSKDSDNAEKETFAAAFSVLEDPVYYIHSTPKLVGQQVENQEINVATLLTDPEEDYQINEIKSAKAPPHNIFVHSSANYLNIPNMILKSTNGQQLGLNTEGNNKNNLKIRFYGNPRENKGLYGEYKDFELSIWKQLEWLICNKVFKEDLKLESYEKNLSSEDKYLLCQHVQSHVDWLISHA